MKKKVLVTGGLGFVGSNLVDMLIEKGAEVFVIDDLSSGYESNGNPKAKYQIMDMTKFNVSDWEIDEELDAIFHIAARARIQPSFSDPVTTMNVNVMGTVKMLELARVTNAKFIYAGSSSATGDANINPYAASKFYGEQVVEMYNKSFGVNTAIARFYNVYGQRNVQDEVKGNLLGILQKQYMNNEPFTLIEDCKEKRRDFTHVDDICEGLCRMWKTKKVKDSMIINLGRGDNLSVYDVAMAFKDNAKKEVEIKYLPKRAGELETTLADLTKTKKLLKFEPKKNMIDYIKSWVEEEDSKND